MEKTLFSAAVQNPMFANQMFESATGIQTGANANYSNPNQAVLQGVSEEQLEAMKRWSKILRIAMLIEATLMMITCYYNFGTSSGSVSSNFIALYVLFFSTLLCCYEVGLQQVSAILAQNFGFLYFPIARFIFLVFVSLYHSITIVV